MNAQGCLVKKRDNKPVPDGGLSICAFNAQISAEATRRLRRIAPRLSESADIALEHGSEFDPGRSGSLLEDSRRLLSSSGGSFPQGVLEEAGGSSSMTRRPLAEAGTGLEAKTRCVSALWSLWALFRHPLASRAG